MAALDGTIRTPMGPVKKKTALIGAGAILLIGGIVWYRQKQTANDPDAMVTEAEINPATGFPYGSPEDAAALAAQAGYNSPTLTGGSGSGNPGGSGSSNTDVVVSNNAEWTQAVLEYVQNNGIVEDVSALATALGKYLSGAYVTDTDVALIQQAIAIKGQPPTAGASGYPPSLNRTPPSGGGTTPPPGGGGTTPPPSTAPKNAGPIRNKKTTWTATSAMTKFDGAVNAVRYDVFLDGVYIKSVSGSPFSVGGLKPKSHHTIGLQAVAGNLSKGPLSTTTFWTKSK